MQQKANLTNLKYSFSYRPGVTKRTVITEADILHAAVKIKKGIILIYHHEGLHFHFNLHTLFIITHSWKRLYWL